jgi:hypothetical protein
MERTRVDDEPAGDEHDDQHEQGAGADDHQSGGAQLLDRSS